MTQIEMGNAQNAPFIMRQRTLTTASGEARIEYLTSEVLERAGFLNAFSTRIGGVSPLPHKDLNLSLFRGDNEENVRENRRRFLEVIGAADSALVTAKQTHSTGCAVIESREQADGPGPECDAMTSRLKGVLLGIQTADCLPVLIGDPVSATVAAIHAGWRGTAGRITERTIAALMQNHGVNPRNCIAALGPSACADCYEVGEDVIDLYQSEFGYWKRLLIDFKPGGKAHLDIRAANVQQLLFCGFSEDRIHVAPHCTMHQNDLFFSYRREAKKMPSGVGRLLSVIGVHE